MRWMTGRRSCGPPVGNAVRGCNSSNAVGLCVDPGDVVGEWYSLSLRRRFCRNEVAVDVVVPHILDRVGVSGVGGEPRFDVALIGHLRLAVRWRSQKRGHNRGASPFGASEVDVARGRDKHNYGRYYKRNERIPRLVVIVPVVSGMKRCH